MDMPSRYDVSAPSGYILMASSRRPWGAEYPTSVYARWIDRPLTRVWTITCCPVRACAFDSSESGGIENRKRRTTLMAVGCVSVFFETSVYLANESLVSRRDDSELAVIVRFRLALPPPDSSMTRPPSFSARRPITKPRSARHAPPECTCIGWGSDVRFLTSPDPTLFRSPPADTCRLATHFSPSSRPLLSPVVKELPRRPNNRETSPECRVGALMCASFASSSSASSCSDVSDSALASGTPINSRVMSVPTAERRMRSPPGCTETQSPRSYTVRLTTNSRAPSLETRSDMSFHVYSRPWDPFPFDASTSLDGATLLRPNM
eukprot:Opistho-2@10562